MPTPDRDPSPATPKADKAGEVSVARYEGYGVTLPEDAAIRPVVGELTLLQVLGCYVDEGLSLDVIGARAERSGSLVSKVIKKGTGLSPQQMRHRAGWVGGLTPPHISAQARQLYLDNPTWTVAQVASRIGVGGEVVSAALDAVGVDEASRISRGNHIKRAVLPVSDEELIRLYTVGRLTTPDLGARFGVDASTVARHLKRLKVPVRAKGGGRHPVVGVSIDDMVAMYETQGLSTHTIGARISMNPDTVGAHLRDAGVTLRPNFTARAGTLDTREAVRLYTKSGWSIGRIATHQKVAPRRIKTALLDSKVTLRAPYQRT